MAWFIFSLIKELFRQIEFLSELAILEGSFTGIGFWYIGLTDLGETLLQPDIIELWTTWQEERETGCGCMASMILMIICGKRIVPTTRAGTLTTVWSWFWGAMRCTGRITGMETLGMFIDGVTWFLAIVDPHNHHPSSFKDLHTKIDGFGWNIGVKQRLLGWCHSMSRSTLV